MSDAQNEYDILLFILIFSLSRHLVTLNIYFDLKLEVTFEKKIGFIEWVVDGGICCYSID